MGIDKSNVRWVVHGDLPRSVEGYYQETGRAARDGEDADTLLLYGPSDIASVRWHINNMESRRRRSGPWCGCATSCASRKRRSVGARSSSPISGKTIRGIAGDATCAGEIALEDLTEAARKMLSAAVRTGERFGAHHLVDILTGTATDKVLERGHDSLPTFGVGRDHDRDWWLALARELAASGASYAAKDGRGLSASRERGGWCSRGQGRLSSARVPSRPGEPRGERAARWGCRGGRDSQ